MARPARRLGLATVIAAAALAAATAEAQQQEAGPIVDTQVITLRVMIVQAMADPGTDDPECRDMRKQLPFTPGQLRVVSRQHLQLRFGQQGAVPLPAGRGEVSLLPINIHGGRLHLQLILPGRVNTRMRMQSGNPVILGVPPAVPGPLLVRITPQFK